MAGTAYSIYIVECADRSLYTGIATDVERRLREHENGVRGAKYLRCRKPFRLVFRQAVGDRSTAQRLEARVKRLTRTGKLEIVTGKRTLGELLPAGHVPVDALPV